MPALPPVPGVVRLRMIHQVSEDTNAGVGFFVQYTGTAPTAAQLNTFCQAVAGAWDSNLKAFASLDVKLLEVTAVDLSSSSGAVGSFLDGTTGTRTGHPLPASTSLLVNYHVNRRYRGGKPRSYFPFLVAEDLSDEQTWLAATLTAFTTAWNAFVAAIVGAGWTGAGSLSHVNVSYYEGFASVQNPVTHRWKNLSTPRATPVVDAITAVAINPKPGSQRRRMLR